MKGHAHHLQGKPLSISHSRIDSDRPFSVPLDSESATRQPRKPRTTTTSPWRLFIPRFLLYFLAFTACGLMNSTARIEWSENELLRGYITWRLSKSEIAHSTASSQDKNGMFDVQKEKDKSMSDLLAKYPLPARYWGCRDAFYHTALCVNFVLQVAGALLDFTYLSMTEFSWWITDWNLSAMKSNLSAKIVSSILSIANMLHLSHRSISRQLWVTPCLHEIVANIFIAVRKCRGKSESFWSRTTAFFLHFNSSGAARKSNHARKFQALKNTIHSTMLWVCNLQITLKY